MPKCFYCGNHYEIPRGLTFVRIDGTVNHLCSSKCRKNLLMKRRKIRWVSKKKQETAKELAEEIKAETEEAREEKETLKEAEAKKK